MADPEISKGMRRSVTSDRSIAGPGNQADGGGGGIPGKLRTVRKKTMY